VEHPLTGLRVLDLSRVVAGPFAGRMLSDLGADVVKVEPPAGDISRVWGEQRHGLSGFYTQQNAGKRNVCVDLGITGGAPVVCALAAAADILIENFRPGVLARLELGWDVLHEANPRLIVLSISGFGQSSDRGAYAPVIHAESGVIDRQAVFDGEPPSDPMLSIADYNAGLHGLVALLAALHMRTRTGEGQHIDVAMLDAMLATDDYAHHALDGSEFVRLGGEIWDAPGGPIMVAGVLRNTWAVLSKTYAIEDPSPPGADLSTKIESRRQAVGAWFLTFATRPLVIDALERAGLAWADVRPYRSAFHERDAYATVDDRGGGTRNVVQSPYRFSAATSGVRGGAPHLGEHNEAVLTSWLGWDVDRIAALRASGVLVDGHV
jgi:CoA:oxalate CoA-transferase